MGNVKDGGPAFPMQGQSFTIDDQTFCVSFPGVTVRDWFAGKALVAYLSSPEAQKFQENVIAECSYSMADAMLAAREVKS